MAIGFGLNIPKLDKMVKIKSDLFVWIGGGRSGEGVHGSFRVVKTRPKLRRSLDLHEGLFP